mmetsp:Transcript_59513/g.139403  ORF Transcript_59513/g.139403 Transcript_59513/m.139403 type:complete len:285 (-) Transcript_59513:304-1158(-)
MDARPVRIHHSLREGAHEHRHLKAKVHQSPILESEMGKQWLTFPDVQHILHCVDVDWDESLQLGCILAFGRSCLCLALTAFLLLTLGLVQLFLVLLLLLHARICSLLPDRVGLELLLSVLPVALHTLPFQYTVREGVVREELFHTSGDLLRLHPRLHVVLARNFTGPFVSDLREILRLVREGEVGESAVEGHRHHVGGRAGQEPKPRLLLVQLGHSGRLGLLLGLLLHLHVRIFLGFFLDLGPLLLHLLVFRLRRSAFCSLRRLGLCSLGRLSLLLLQCQLLRP